MSKITTHPVLDVPSRELTRFEFDGQSIEAEKGFTIAAALHRSGHPVHSHSLDRRERSLECGIGKCGACEMLVDGEIRRICITKVDGVKTVCKVPQDFHPQQAVPERDRTTVSEPTTVYTTTVAIVGAGPAGLAAREVLDAAGVANLLIDSNDTVGGQFVMQTHQFFFFEREKAYGGLRGPEISEKLAGPDRDDILLNSIVWDVLEGNRLAVRNSVTHEIYYVDAEYLIVATGAIPFMPPFKNDDLPGVYTAAVVQKMMNNEFTLLGKNVLTVGAGNIGYLTSYQLRQAGASVKAIVEASPTEGGFPVQANRVRRLGIPIVTSHILIEAIPNESRHGIRGAVIAECRDFKPIPGTEKAIDGIDAINICTGLVPDNQLLEKGCIVFGRNCFGAGDVQRVGEGTSAVLRGKQAALQVIQAMGDDGDYPEFLALSKELIDSRQHPLKVADAPALPTPERMRERPFVQIDCLYGFACNPCVFACPHGAIQKDSTTTVPAIAFDACVGCMECVYQCPGLAIFGYNFKRNTVVLPLEFDFEHSESVALLNNNGEVVDTGTVKRVLPKANRTRLAFVEPDTLRDEAMLQVRSFLPEGACPEPIEYAPRQAQETQTYICHCEDVRLEEIMAVVGKRKFISVDDVKHTTRLGMGACRGKRCFRRLKGLLRAKGVSLVGTPTARAPLSSMVKMGEVYPGSTQERIVSNVGGRRHDAFRVKAFVAGGGIGGSALFRYLAEAGMAPVMVNAGHGASWRNIAGGRPNFSLPELSEIACENKAIFQDLQARRNIDYRTIRYVTFAHDEAMRTSLEQSMGWSDATFISPDEFTREISPFLNPHLDTYLGALVTENCWQATPGKVIDLIRTIGIEHGGTVLEDSKVVDVVRSNGLHEILVETHEGKTEVFHAEIFINALGCNVETFARKLGIETGIYPVKHQAFITRRLPPLGIDGAPLPMIIDRRKVGGFTAVYGQQLAETGQIIGCASPDIDATETWKDQRTNSRAFLEIVSETFVNWLPELATCGYQAVWSGYYVEPRMIVDPALGLFAGLRGQGFMLGQHLAKLYVDKLTGREVPSYFDRLAMDGDGLLEKTFK